MQILRFDARRGCFASTTRRASNFGNHPLLFLSTTLVISRFISRDVFGFTRSFSTFEQVPAVLPSKYQHNHTESSDVFSSVRSAIVDSPRLFSSARQELRRDIRKFRQRRRNKKKRKKSENSRLYLFRVHFLSLFYFFSRAFPSPSPILTPFSDLELRESDQTLCSEVNDSLSDMIYVCMYKHADRLSLFSPSFSFFVPLYYTLRDDVPIYPNVDAKESTYKYSLYVYI